VSSVRILVVDDDADVRALIDDILQDAGFATAVAADGRAALERLGGEAFDLLVSDIRMPGMDGFELARRAREMRPDLPVIFVSAYSPTFDLQAGDEFIRKPFRPRELVGSIRSLLCRGEGS
jgi:CheY-like chemotaxis protein